MEDFCRGEFVVEGLHSTKQKLENSFPLQSLRQGQPDVHCATMMYSFRWTVAGSGIYSAVPDALAIPGVVLLLSDCGTAGPRISYFFPRFSIKFSWCTI